MKKENRRMAQERRAKERRKKALQKKISKLIVYGIPSAVVIVLVLFIIISEIKGSGNTDSSQNTSSTTEQDTEKTDENSSKNSDTDSSTSYSSDSSLTVEDGDTVNIDYVGSIDGVEFDGGNTNGQGTDLVIGSGSYIDDFEEQLIGTHPGDKVDVNVTFPDEYASNPDLAGKEAHFEVTINGIYQ